MAGTAVVKAALAIAGQEDTRLRRAQVRALPRSEGAANRVFRVTAAGGVFFAKLRLDPYRGNRRERWALELLRGRGAPPLLHATSVDAVAVAHGWHFASPPGGDILILGALGGAPATSWSEAQLAVLAGTLAALHRHRPRRGPELAGGTRARLMIPAMRAALAAVEESGLLAPGVIAGLRRLLRAATRHVRQEPRGPTPRPLALCHGDLRPPNVLFTPDGQAQLIDFEYAGRADPMIDLARLVVYSELSRHAELCLLDAYAQAAGPRGLAGYFGYRAFAPLAAALGAAHYLALAANARIEVARGFVTRRTPHVERRLSLLLGEPVRLRRRPRRSK